VNLFLFFQVSPVFHESGPEFSRLSRHRVLSHFFFLCLRFLLCGFSPRLFCFSGFFFHSTQIRPTPFSWPVSITDLLFFSRAFRLPFFSLIFLKRLHFVCCCRSLRDRPKHFPANDNHPLPVIFIPLVPGVLFVISGLRIPHKRSPSKPQGLLAFLVTQEPAPPSHLASPVDDASVVREPGTPSFVQVQCWRPLVPQRWGTTKTLRSLCSQPTWPVCTHQETFT